MILLKYEEMNNVPILVKQIINTIDMHKNDSVITCTTVILSVMNELKTFT